MSDYKNEPFKWVWGYIKKYLLQYIIALILCVIVAVLALINPYIVGKIVDEVFQKNMADRLMPLITIMVSVTFFRTVIRYIFANLIESATQRVLFDLRVSIYKRVADQNFHFFDTNRVGDIMSRMTGDLDAIRHFLSHVVHTTVESVLTFVAALVFMFMISWEVTVFLLVVAPIISVVTFKQSAEIKPKFMLIREQFSRLNSVCQESISGNRVVKAFTKEDFEIQKFTKENQDYLQSNLNANKVWVKYYPYFEFCAGLLSFFNLLIGGALIIYGKMELWQLVTINGYLWAINNPMRNSGNLVNDTQRFVASLEKIYTLIRQKIHIYSPENPVRPERIKGEIEFKNVSFGYDKNNLDSLVLKNVSFKIKAGGTLGIVGATGAGKTTLINLVSRFYDVFDGEVLVDGVNVKDYDLLYLRRGIAAATQDVFLFSDSVEGNIAYGVPDAPSEEVYKAAGVASADGFVKTLEEGYDTVIGERGVGLSGGQKQRLALARAIATNPAILILDDTTSAVDMETEHEIQLALKEKYADRTTIIIAHRISSVKPADLILVLDGCEVIEAGSHDELIAKQGYYYGLFVSQYGNAEGDDC